MEGFLFVFRLCSKSPASLPCNECVNLRANRFPMTWENGIDFPASFFVYPRHWKTEFEIPFSFSCFIENEFPTSIFVFRFPTTLDNGILIVIFFFRLLFLENIENRNLNLDLRFSFLYFCHFRRNVGTSYR